MYHNYYLRAAAFAAAVCLTFTGCSSKTTGASENDSHSANAINNAAPVTDEHDVQTADQMIEMSTAFKYDKVSLPEDVRYLLELTQTDDGILADAAVKTDDPYSSEHKIYLFSDDFSSSKVIDLQFPEEYTSSEEHDFISHFSQDGSIFTLLNMYDHNGMKYPTTAEEAENFNFDAYEANTTYSCCVCIFDKDGKLRKKIPLNNWGEYCEENDGYLIGIYGYEDSYAFALRNGTFLKVNDDGSFEEIIKPNEDEYDSYMFNSYLLQDKDGNIIKVDSKFDEESSQNIATFSHIDLKNKKVSEPFFTLKNTYLDGTNICTGFGDYFIGLSKEDGFYGVKEDGSSDLIISWSDSDLLQSKIFPLKDGTYLAYDSNYDQMTFLHLTMRPASDFENVKVITMATFGATDYYANNFNSSQSDYRIKCVDYSQYIQPDDYKGESMMKQLKMDIISGNAPDIIFMDDINTIKELGEKGALADLYSLMENDSEINKDTFLPNILQAFESGDGKLYALTTGFEVDTIFAKTSACDKENWTIDDMISLYDNAPASYTRLYDHKTKNDIFQTLISNDSDLIDYEKVECHFDSDDFLKILEFSNRFVDEVDMPSKADGEYEELQQYYYDLSNAIKDDKAYIDTIHLDDIDGGYGFERDLVAGGVPITFVGYPSNNGQGGKLAVHSTYSISSTCPNKEGAWLFLRTLFTKDNQTNSTQDQRSAGYHYGFSVRRDIFEQQMDKTMYFIDFETGEKSDTRMNKGEEYHALSQPERDHLEEYILNCHTLKNTLDDEIYNICLEESAAYFAGEISANEAADRIQNRVQIIISERS